jgi:hypothetical protein
MPATTAQNATAAVGIDIGKNVFYIVGPCSMPPATWTRRGEVSAAAIKHRARIRLTICQRTRVLEQWPVAASSTVLSPLRWRSAKADEVVHQHTLYCEPLKLWMRKSES